MKIIKVSSNGEIKTFAGDFNTLDKKAHSIKRVSNIYPENTILRYIFILLRKTFGDNGIIAAWTRKWKVRWTVHIDKNKFGPFASREEAIKFEKKWIAKDL